ncbi:putative chromosome-partitioning protein ParB [bioreactor metagenome]|jgi:ParB family chromosome partitioning protein|uniref:Putative chromosome-partitioning protein ParB n=1 Tax=bioreactor metagenome TaxID=1076179 RepID=A0A644YZ56_9ZZZZ
MSQKAALGKGLGALISDAGNAAFNKPAKPETPATPASIAEIPVEKISANPYQPRTTFDEQALSELSESIKTLGLIQPITVRQLENGNYQIISGERRFRAASMAGLSHIPAYIRKADDQGMLEMAIVENIQRENLDAIEVALSFQRLIEECSLTQEAMAERVGKKRATVTNYLRLLKLPAEIQLALRAQKLTMGHARALLSIEDPEQQIALCDQIIEGNMSVREVEATVHKMNNPQSEEVDVQPEKEKPTKKVVETPQEIDESFIKIAEIFGKYTNNNVSVRRSEKGESAVTFKFSDDKDVLAFIEALEKTNL